MGRPYTGAQTTASALRITTRDVLGSGVQDPTKRVEVLLKWPSGHLVKITSAPGGGRIVVDFTSAQGERFTHPVELATVPSNLGRGEVVYFRCPRSGRRARILYRAYGSRAFLHRKALQLPLYHPAQVEAKLERIDGQIHRTEAKLERLRRGRRQTTYMGRTTKRTARREAAVERLVELEEARWSVDNMPKRLVKILSDAALTLDTV